SAGPMYATKILPMAEIHVTVAWATLTEQDLVPVTIASGATVSMAIEASGLPSRHGIAILAARVGINGRLVEKNTVVSNGDRVELYRPLIADPKQVRRTRAKKVSGKHQASKQKSGR